MKIRMLADLVVDTNVLVHAHNTEHAYCEDAKALVESLLAEANTTLLRVDAGFDPVEAQNRSRIIGEYLQKLVPGMAGHHMVQTLAAEGRVAPVPACKDSKLRGAVRALVKDSFDRVFLLTALASKEKTLVSHDDEAFSDSVRDDCKEMWNASVCDAPDVVAILT
jgi:hypothetical protein